jgi:glycosyltransferase involved in cell wall biosynthesis
MKKPIIHAYFVCYNEANILPHLLKHYLSFCERVTILDNHSTDNSAEIINSFPNTEIIPFTSNNEFHDGVHIKLKNHVWKSSIGIADYVILGDTDEFLYHENMINFLTESFNKGVTLFKPIGYHMVANENFILKADDNIFEKVTDGVRTEVLDKMMMFNCNKITNINYGFGCHGAVPQGEIVLSAGELKMLHYKFLGLEDHMYKQKIRGERLSSFNKENGFGLYYLFTEEEQIIDYRSYLNKRQKVIK